MNLSRRGYIIANLGEEEAQVLDDADQGRINNLLERHKSSVMMMVVRLLSLWTEGVQAEPYIRIAQRRLYF
jgi:hypothetical protein